MWALLSDGGGISCSLPCPVFLWGRQGNSKVGWRTDYSAPYVQHLAAFRLPMATTKKVAMNSFPEKRGSGKSLFMSCKHGSKQPQLWHTVFQTFPNAKEKITLTHLKSPGCHFDFLKIPERILRHLKQQQQQQGSSDNSREMKGWGCPDPKSIHAYEKRYGLPHVSQQVKELGKMFCVVEERDLGAVWAWRQQP